LTGQRGSENNVNLYELLNETFLKAC
jgi:RNA-directed DNA polymerase